MDIGPDEIALLLTAIGMSFLAIGTVRHFLRSALAFAILTASLFRAIHVLGRTKVYRKDVRSVRG